MIVPKCKATYFIAFSFSSLELRFIFWSNSARMTSVLSFFDYARISRVFSASSYSDGVFNMTVSYGCLYSPFPLPIDIMLLLNLFEIVGMLFLNIFLA